MFIAGLQKSSLLDYPEKIAAIVFTQGCNFRCGYCHNPELLSINSKKQPFISEDDFFNFLEKRKGKLDGVVITGGEPCLQKDLVNFIEKIKNMGFLVKLDTNGTFPDKLQTFLDNQLIDYVAMDIKSPLEKYHKITSSLIKKGDILKSIDLIMNSGVDYEFRTTVIKSQLSFEDLENISILIKGAKCYYLQKFEAFKIYNQALINEKTYTASEFKEIIEILKKNVCHVELR
ncbi:anaerobic ribonucleoside-triphosphate reductase activating protein [bacterium]|nr:anaerobic ribonucleoside-triphosphate reductase activating protein [bacterium]